MLLPIALTPLDIGRLYVRWMHRGWSLYLLAKLYPEGLHTPENKTPYAALFQFFQTSQERSELPFDISFLESCAFTFLWDYVVEGLHLDRIDEHSMWWYSGLWWEHMHASLLQRIAALLEGCEIAVKKETDPLDHAKLSSLLRYYNEMGRQCLDLLDIPAYQSLAVRRLSYPAYLQSPGWKLTRLAALYRADYRCQICSGTDRLEVHHRTYDRLGDEAATDLIVLDDACHRMFHQNSKLKR